jgi:hypothetical protein
MDKSLQRRVWLRARDCCEYCLMPQEYDDASFEIDHVIAQKHDGQTTSRNLALSCNYCNSFKGANIAGRDPKTRRLKRLFNPRRDSWLRHFRWQGAALIGRTAIGRVTIAVLKINDPLRVELRQTLIDEGVFPPT